MGSWLLALSLGKACIGRSLGAEEREGPCADDGASSVSTLPDCIRAVHLLLAANVITYPAQARGEGVVNN